MTSPSGSGSGALPLFGIRIIDSVDGPLQGTSRILADLGAEVLRVEAAEGSPARAAGIVHGGAALSWMARNANKTSVVAHPSTAQGAERLRELLADADILLFDWTPEQQSAWGFGREELRRINPRLVAASLTDFGQTGSRNGWKGTPDVHFAMSTVLSRSGLPEVTEPLLPPAFLAYEAASAQAAWAVLLAFVSALGSGNGEYVDYSSNDGLIQILDPALGIGGSARAGESLMDLPPGRPDARHLYPIFPVQDGWVRICVLSARQWQGMFRWLGEPEEFADPKFNSIAVRFGSIRTLYPLIGALLHPLTRAEATEQGQALGVPTAGLADLSEALATDAFRESGSFAETELPDGRTATFAAGVFEIDGVRSTVRTAAPALAAASDPLPARGNAVRPSWSTGEYPFAGLRVIDLGVIVVGAELGRLFGDYGADVIKVESTEFPDGARGSMDGSEIADGLASGQRNKQSLGLNLKSDGGKRLFRELVAMSDVVLANFKPGTLESLGFGYEELAAINPGVILSESSAFGDHGPWSRRMGYGPLVRASAGMSRLWSYPDIDGSFSDSITIYPDHVVGRLNAIAVTSLLLRRSITGLGGRVSTAQVDAIFSGMSELLALESLAPGSVTADSNHRDGDAPRGIFPAAGEDNWVVVDVTDDAEFAALARALGRSDWAEDRELATATGRVARRAELQDGVAEWARARDAAGIADQLQSAGVPAAKMMRPADLASDEHLGARGVFGTLIHPLRADPLMTNLGEAIFEAVPKPLLAPAPRQAEHTRELARRLFGLTDQRIDELVAGGDLQIHPAVAALQHA